MGLLQMKVPSPGESISEVEIAAWLVSEGDYVYKDRKMMKWMPFNALLEQGDYINDLLNGRIKKEMPVLSVDQRALLQCLTGKQQSAGSSINYQ